VDVRADNANPMVSVLSLDKAPTDGYTDISGLQQPLQEVKVRIVIPLLSHDIYHRHRILSSYLSPT